MRSAIATMFVAAGVATAAVAQTPAATPAAPPAAPTAPAAPATTAPTAPAAPATTAPAAVAPTAPAAPAAPAAAPAAPEPTLPTSGDGAEVVAIVQKVCVPLVKGGDVNQLAPAAGMKKIRKGGIQSYQIMLGGVKQYTVTLEPQGTNRDVCSLTLNYAIDGEKPIIAALNIWAYLHDPYMPVQRNDYVPATDVKRITNSWEYYDEHVSNGLVFLQLKKPDGTSLNPKFDLATVLYSERHF